MRCRSARGTYMTTAEIAHGHSGARRFDQHIDLQIRQSRDGRGIVEPNANFDDSGIRVGGRVHVQDVVLEDHRADVDDGPLERLRAKGFFVYRFLDGTVRFRCSWATTPEAVDELGETLKDLA